MNDINYYAKLFFNEETGKERYGLMQKEAQLFCKNKTVAECWEAAQEYYQCDLYYIQAFAVYIMGIISSEESRAYHFLKDTVSNHPSWQVQEFLGMATKNH
jgi:hypothetical protein